MHSMTPMELRAGLTGAKRTKANTGRRGSQNAAMIANVRPRLWPRWVSVSSFTPIAETVE
jgi:hypothetical protein